MKSQHLLGWAMIAVVLLFIFAWLGYTKPAGAYDNFYEEDQGGVWLDPNAPVQPYHRRPTPRYHQPQPAYRDSQPYHYGPVDQQPDIIIYRDGRRFTTH